MKHELRLRYRARLVMAAAVFLMAACAGAIWAAAHAGEGITNRPAAELCALAQGPPSLRGLADILVSNALVFLNLVVGGALLWVRSTAQLLSVGLDTGSLVYLSHRATGSALFTAASLATHGVAEIAAFLGAAATGIRVGCVALALYAAYPYWKVEALGLGRELRIPAAVLMAAAVVEEFVTARVMTYVVCW